MKAVVKWKLLAWVTRAVAKPSRRTEERLTERRLHDDDVPCGTRVDEVLVRLALVRVDRGHHLV